MGRGSGGEDQEQPKLRPSSGSDPYSGFGNKRPPKEWLKAERDCLQRYEWLNSLDDQQWQEYMFDLLRRTIASPNGDGSPAFSWPDTTAWPEDFRDRGNGSSPFDPNTPFSFKDQSIVTRSDESRSSDSRKPYDQEDPNLPPPILTPEELEEWLRDPTLRRLMNMLAAIEEEEDPAKRRWLLTRMLDGISPEEEEEFKEWLEENKVRSRLAGGAAGEATGLILGVPLVGTLTGLSVEILFEKLLAQRDERRRREEARRARRVKTAG